LSNGACVVASFDEPTGSGDALDGASFTSYRSGCDPERLATMSMLCVVDPLAT